MKYFRVIKGTVGNYEPGAVMPESAMDSADRLIGYGVIEFDRDEPDQKPVKGSGVVAVQVATPAQIAAAGASFVDADPAPVSESKA